MSAGARDLLARHGLRARRDLGQNFLVDEALARKLVTLSGVEPGDAVLEIGTGLGVLTRALAARARCVSTLEVDAGIVRALRAEQALPESVELIHADAMRFDLEGWIARARPPVRVVANLPYAIASPLLRRLLGARAGLAGWAVMVQREVAARVLAAPRTPDYGSLAVLHRLAVRVERALDVHARCFHPVPKVASSFLRMTPLEPAPLAADELEAVERVVRAAFSHRRKTLSNALRRGLAPAPEPAGLARRLEALGIDPRARAEALAPLELLELARALAAA